MNRLVDVCIERGLVLEPTEETRTHGRHLDVRAGQLLYVDYVPSFQVDYVPDVALTQRVRFGRK